MQRFSKEQKDLANQCATIKNQTHKMKKEKTQNKKFIQDDEITRKEALKKAGKYAAFTASAMLTILHPKESQATSTTPESPPDW